MTTPNAPTATTVPVIESKPAAFTLWYRPSTGRTAWQPVFGGESEYACVCAIGCGNRHNGKWLIMPAGQEP